MVTILFADDNTNIREYCRRELEEEGYRVIVARDGAEAIRLASSDVPDLAVLDICMPGMNGLEAVPRIRAAKPDVPIVFFTSHDDACVQDQRAGYASACVQKCEDLTELKLVIASVLRSHHCGRPYRLGLPPAVLTANAGPS